MFEKQALSVSNRIVVVLTGLLVFSVLPVGTQIDENSDSNNEPRALTNFQDHMNVGELGPRMVVVPIGGAKVRNCIPEKVCNETITDILRSMIDMPYAISKYEITFAEYDLFATVTGRDLPEDNGWGRGTQPVIFVAWKDTLAYVNWLSEQTGFTYRLPTVVEWEHAARAGEHTAYWWGPELQHNRANCSECKTRWSEKRAAPVGSFNPNPWGIHDMHGNVSEFTQDCSIVNKQFRLGKRKRFWRLSEPAWFNEDCEWVHLKGSSWLSTDDCPFRTEKVQNNPHFPKRFFTYHHRNSSAALGMRVVREL